MKIEIYLEDLKEHKQKEILKAKGVEDIKDTNLDVIPLHIMEIEE